MSGRNSTRGKLMIIRNFHHLFLNRMETNLRQKEKTLSRVLGFHPNRQRKDLEVKWMRVALDIYRQLKDRDH